MKNSIHTHNTKRKCKKKKNCQLFPRDSNILYCMVDAQVQWYYSIGVFKNLIRIINHYIPLEQLQFCKW